MVGEGREENSEREAWLEVGENHPTCHPRGSLSTASIVLLGTQASGRAPAQPEEECHFKEAHSPPLTPQSSPFWVYLGVCHA